MKNPEDHIEVTIIGGGPVGLFLAICLLKEGIHCRVLEKRKYPVPDSRSLGIHPVSLELFDQLGISDPFLRAGLKIKKGIAHTGKKKLGEISFEYCPKPHNYILACPQFSTEKILRYELKKMGENALITEAEFLSFNEDESSVHITYKTNNGQQHALTSNWVVGCDGKNSAVRKQASIPYLGKPYDDTYIMGDFEDTTSFGTDAVVYLTDTGLIECFPLPNGMRRWVVKTDSYIKNPAQNDIVTLVKNRLGFDLHTDRCTMLSSFGVQHYMAEQFVKGRVILAGDAAHVVSPIGGQGMNLGWLGCKAIADLFSVNKHALKPEVFHSYSQKQKQLARKVASRAEINMALGRKHRFSMIRNLSIKALLNSPLKKQIAQLFTMRGIEKWWI